jgi:hypothetical protein
LQVLWHASIRLNDKIFLIMGKKNVFIILCAVILGIFVINFQKGLDIESLKGKDIKTILTKLPSKDRKNLEKFFRSAFVFDHFGYVLFGNKPMAISSYVPHFFYIDNGKIFFSFSYFAPSNLKNKKNYEIWLKYQKLFPLKKYILKTEQNPWIKNSRFILLINKKKFVQTIENNISDFDSVFNKETAPFSLLEQAKQQNLLKDILLSHDALIGMLLGYGKNNSWKYYERYNNNKKHPLVYVWQDDSLQNEILSRLNKPTIKHLLDIYSLDLNFILLPSFVADISSQETKLLKNNYHQIRKHILDYYTDRDFLETTLEHLTE